MTHVEACKEQWQVFNMSWLRPDQCPVCKSYQRGREDAAKAVKACNYYVGAIPDEWVVLLEEDAIAAARGDGGCQHDWQHLKGEKCPTCRRCGAARGDGEQA